MAGLVRGAAGVIHSVSYADGLISVVVYNVANDVDAPYIVLRHRVGARNGISLAASRALWLDLIAARNNNDFVEFSGRAGWAGWFDVVDVITFVTQKHYLSFLRLTAKLSELPEDDEDELNEYLASVEIEA